MYLLSETVMFHCKMLVFRGFTSSYSYPIPASQGPSRKDTSNLGPPKVETYLKGSKNQPLIGNPYNGSRNRYYWVDEFIPYYMGNNGSLDPSTHDKTTHQTNLSAVPDTHFSSDSVMVPL